PKGPSLDPAAKHLAVHVEDHPIEYLDFEGVIPAGEYGGGDVIVWDRGTWEPHDTDDPVGAVEAGELHVDLYGEKLRGRFILIRRDADRGGKEQWLLFHKRDEHAVAGWDPEAFPNSVRSGRTNEEVAAHPEALWRSGAETAVANIDFSSTRADIAALDALGAKGAWDFDGVTLHLTNLDKVLFPPQRRGGRPVTKRDLIRYYAQIAPVMLPYLRDRALNMHRYPDGVGRPGFWHKEVPGHAPDWITRWHYDAADADESQHYIVADRPATLAWLANFGAVELHAWTSRIDAPDCPTYALIDVDPGDKTSWEEVLTLARLYRTVLEHLAVRGVPKVTGQRGVQVWVPIRTGPGFDETRAWVEAVSRAIGQTVPQLVSWKWQKRERGGLARLDYTQNAINKTLVAPYSVRAAPGATVSMPIHWDELDDPELRSDRWCIGDVGTRVMSVGDVFAGVLDETQALPTV
ncbi:MAG TPA: non-homologous end-joining DNA ligase, partial [Acidimicrobiia bacterium]|nr:non-homologous end-joining DNA ligase [Acidimicrobiia bacterium]